MYVLLTPQFKEMANNDKLAETKIVSKYIKGNQAVYLVLHTQVQYMQYSIPFL